MRLQRIKNLVSAALFAAIICVATYIVQIPMPATGGYVNLGDCFVLTAGMMLGAGYGAMAAGIGSALADMLAGYMQYAPATFVIKALMAIAAYYIYKSLGTVFSSKLSVLSKATAVIAAEAIMVLGYFAYESTILGYGLAAAGSIFGNAIQGAVGAVAAIVLVTALEKTSSKSKTVSSFFKAGQNK